MKSLSPSSRLVLAAIALAFVVVAAVGATRSPTNEPLVTPTPAGVVEVPSGSGPDLAVVPSAGALPTHSRAPKPTARPTRTPTAPSTPRPTACKPTDQDRYVYHPYRLVVQAACIRVTGTVEAIRREADGDVHILLALDPAYAHLLTPANQGVELGDLVVEPVCVHSVSQTDAIAVCASDPDPMGALPGVGDRVWMEGRYVFDSDHGGWAELHPLYHWGDR